MRTFGEELRRLMAERGVSLRGLARLVHYDPGHLSRVVNGRTPPSVGLARAVDAALDAGGTLVRLVPTPARPSPGMEVLLEGAERGRPLDAEHVATIRATAGHLVALDGLHGGRDLWPLAVRAFRAAYARLGSCAPGVARDAHAAVAELAELAGWLLFDAEQHADARSMNHEALALARAAGDRSMELLITQNMSMHAAYLGRDRESLLLARSVLESGTLTSRVRALFKVREARALAQSGDRAGAFDALAEARSLYLDGVGPADPPWTWWVDDRELAIHQGVVHAQFAEWEQAAEHFHQAVARAPDSYPWARYIAGGRLLEALVRLRAWADAEPVAVDVLALAGEVSSARADRLLLRVAELAGQAGSAVPSTLADALVRIGRRG